eukprot:2754243-Pleurochrysis_carterae.AAC.1
MEPLPRAVRAAPRAARTPIAAILMRTHSRSYTCLRHGQRCSRPQLLVSAARAFYSRTRRARARAHA